MSNSKKLRKAEKPDAKPSNHKKRTGESIALRILKISLVIVLGIVLAMGIMARVYHYNKYEFNKKK